eukprot:TRINITY_DN29773_c0_g2_i1.p1 TRINITY_DN29773_c0_g2~~TRINITY_DN29773_c0_g2_i1.p1  ORF type:complete len:401 (-),score=61.80 TRINITY_DN29773_c0_g2_i1:22-1077(-)
MHSLYLLLFLQRVCHIVIFTLDYTTLSSPFALHHLNALRISTQLRQWVPPVCFTEQDHINAETTAANNTDTTNNTTGSGSSVPRITLQSMATNIHELRLYHQPAHWSQWSSSSFVPELVILLNKCTANNLSTQQEEERLTFLKRFFTPTSQLPPTTREMQSERKSGYRYKTYVQASDRKPAPTANTENSTNTTDTTLPKHLTDPPPLRVLSLPDHAISSFEMAARPQEAPQHQTPPLSSQGGQLPRHLSPQLPPQSTPLTPVSSTSSASSDPQDPTEMESITLFGQACAQLCSELQQIVTHNSTAYTHFPTKSLTEKDWLHNCVRVWEIIRKAPVVAEFNKTMQKLQLYKN